MLVPSLLLISLSFSLGEPTSPTRGANAPSTTQRMALALAPAPARAAGPETGPARAPTLAATPAATPAANPPATPGAKPGANPGAKPAASASEASAEASAREPVTSSSAGDGLRDGPRVPAEIALLDRRQRRIQTAGMATLTGWSIANIVGGVAGNLATPRGDPWRYAHQMNAMWNTVNLTLGAIGLANARKARSKVGRRLGVRAEVAKTQRIFAVNALLDVAYMLGGAITWEIGKDRESPRLIGYGASIIGQGAFLMLFDLAMVSAHERGLRKSLPGYSVSAMPTAGGAVMSLGGAF